jgi:hypothetical protein
VCPIRYRGWTVWSWQFNGDRDGYTSSDGFISWSLLKKALSQFAFHLDDTSLFIAGLNWQAGNNKSVFLKFNDCLAKASTFSFPRIPTWLGMQYSLTDFVLSISWFRKRSFLYHDIVGFFIFNEY